MGRYIKNHKTTSATQDGRPVLAMQYTGDNRQELVEWSGRYIYEGNDGALDVYTAHGVAPLHVGDWLVHSKGGVYYPVSKKTFDNCYIKEVS